LLSALLVSSWFHSTTATAKTSALFSSPLFIAVSHDNDATLSETNGSETTGISASTQTVAKTIPGSEAIVYTRTTVKCSGWHPVFPGKPAQNSIESEAILSNQEPFDPFEPAQVEIISAVISRLKKVPELSFLAKESLNLFGRDFHGELRSVRSSKPSGPCSVEPGLTYVQGVKINRA